jgi:hypothetical protein
MGLIRDLRSKFAGGGGGGGVWGTITGLLSDQTDLQNALNAKQNSLSFTPEDVANKSANTSLGSSDVLYPTQRAVKFYTDAGLNVRELKADFYKQSLGSNFTTTLDTLQDTNIVFPIEPSEEWQFKFFLQHGCNGTGGLKYAISLPAGATIRAVIKSITSGNTAYTSQIISSTAEIAINLNTVASQGGWAEIIGYVINSATAGAVRLQMRAITAGQTVTLYRESTVNCRRIV